MHWSERCVQACRLGIAVLEIARLLYAGRQTTPMAASHIHQRSLSKRTNLSAGQVLAAVNAAQEVALTDCIAVKTVEMAVCIADIASLHCGFHYQQQPYTKSSRHRHGKHQQKRNQSRQELDLFK